MENIEYNAILIQKVDISPGLSIFRIIPDGWDLPDFIPGQYAVIGLYSRERRISGSEKDENVSKENILIKRAYSIASSSVSKEYLELYIAHVESGAFTPRLFALKPGNRLWLDPNITGMFTLDDVPKDKHILFIATGTGLAPYMSMIRTHLPRGSNRLFAIFHGARHSWDLGYRSELMSFKRLCPNFSYIPVISETTDEEKIWSGYTGRVQVLWKENILRNIWGFNPTPENTHVFLCGNPSMITDMVDLLKKDGFSVHSKKGKGEIHFEKYW